MVEVIPVVDIRNGTAVSGKSGDRENYQPLQSIYSNDSDPIKIAENLPFKHLYIADLDGIVYQRPDLKILKKLSNIKSTMIDLGVRESEDLNFFKDLNSDIVLGTETLREPGTISKAIELFDNRVIVSVDIKNGEVLSPFLSVKSLEAYNIVIELGVKKVLFLNISAVGTKNSDFSFLKDINKSCEIILGGGIIKKDFEAMEKIKVDGVLVGTALHKGLWK
jgi:phosphoribosylformimino-5-aminoimidazole carboxamide ribotide isomerase